MARDEAGLHCLNENNSRLTDPNLSKPLLRTRDCGGGGKTSSRFIWGTCSVYLGYLFSLKCWGLPTARKQTGISPSVDKTQGPVVSMAGGTPLEARLPLRDPPLRLPTLLLQRAPPPPSLTRPQRLCLQRPARGPRLGDLPYCPGVQALPARCGARPAPPLCEPQFPGGAAIY